MGFQFRILLAGVKKPPVWREVVVDEKITFHHFHDILQRIMDWDNSHMYQFSPGGYGSLPRFMLKTEYAESEFSSVSKLAKGHEGIYDSKKVKLENFFTEQRGKIVYIYDFGDNWKLIITLKSKIPEKVDFPYLTGGKGKCPPDDCGGIWGYQNMLDALNDPNHPEHEDMREWLCLDDGEGGIHWILTWRR